jgi:hypothetical protein
MGELVAFSHPTTRPLPGCAIDRFSHKAAENADGVRDVRACGNGEVHERADGADIWHGAHEGLVVGSGRRLIGAKTSAWIEWRRDRARVREAKAIEQVQDVLALTEVQCALGTVASDLNA